MLRGPVETHFGRSGRPRDVHARVPFPAASVTAQPCRLDGCSHTCRLRAPVKTRCETREAFQHSRYMRPTTLVNLRRSTRRAGKVEHMSRAIGLTSATHLRYMHSGHPLIHARASLITSDEVAMLTTAYESSIRQVGWQMVAARAWRAAATL